MASSTYMTLLAIVSTFVDEAKAREVIGRQLPKCNATPDNLNGDNLKSIAHFLSGAIGLYIADKDKRAELTRKISALAGV